MLNPSRYNFKEIENKWQKFWRENSTFKVNTNLKKKKILLP